MRRGLVSRFRYLTIRHSFVIRHWCFVIYTSHESDQRRTTAGPAELALRDETIRSREENFAGRLDGVGGCPDPFTIVLRIAALEIHRHHRSDDAGEAFSGDMEPAAGSRLFALHRLCRPYDDDGGAHRQTRSARCRDPRRNNRRLEAVSRRDGRGCRHRLGPGGPPARGGLLWL